MNILFASSEVYPLIKTGGLADVSGQLPKALHDNGADVRIIMPAYRGVSGNLSALRTIASLQIDNHDVEILESRLPGSAIKLWLVNCPELYDRDGSPYQDPSGNDWPDNAERFAVYNRTVCAIALGDIEIDWRADIVHCNDWQTGLIPALLKQQPASPPTLFTIHNLAYQGLFPYETFQKLALPPWLWSHEALEFHGQMSFIKGGLVFADRINTVSPHYAEEIKTPVFGCGMDGLLRHRSNALSGILNGIDPEEWNPETDSYLRETFNARNLDNKSPNKLALQALFGLPKDENRLLLAMVSRLTGQKGLDTVIAALPELATQPVQLAILGTGDKAIEKALQTAAKSNNEQLSVKIAYDEAWAHLLIGGADIFLMPSHFEPCGLTQLYSLRYGTIPMVRNVGGLADTVVDANLANLESGAATGIVIDSDSTAALIAAVKQGLKLYKNKTQWHALQTNGMQQEFSWAASAKEYMRLYRQLLT
jgi:starch synthase